LRLTFNRPVHGVTALTEWSLLFVAFLGAAWLQRNYSHVRVDIVERYLPPAANKALLLLSATFGLAATGVIVYFGTWVTYNKYVEGEYDFFKLPWMPIFLIYAVIPFGSALWFIEILKQTVRSFRGSDGFETQGFDGL
jgi:C4-dicarboxylate transporter, DctQ subunit